MAKIFRFSGYAVNPNGDCEKGDIEEFLKNYGYSFMQQLHIEESEEFEWDDDLEINKINCDLAYLTQYFKKETPMKYDRPLPQKGDVYKHFKTGKGVSIIGISRHTETEEINVVYKHDGTIWCRPLDMFMSEVDREKYPDVEQKYRFEKVV